MKKINFGFMVCDTDQQRNSYPEIELTFDFDNNLLFVNGKKFKAKEDREYTYKFTKTLVKADGGLKGLYEYAETENNNLCTYFYHVVKEIANK